MSSPHLPGPHGFIIASKLSFLMFLFFLFSWGSQLISSQEKNKVISVQPVPLLNSSSSLFNNFNPNSFQIIPYVEPNSFQIIPYVEPNSFQIIPYFEPNSFQIIPYFEPNSFQIIPYFEPNSFQIVPYFEPDSFQIEPNASQTIYENNSAPILHETPPKTTSEQAILLLLMRLQDNFLDTENTTSENQTIQNNIERNIIFNQINSFFIYSI